MREIPLTQGKVALIDDEDFELVRQHKWCAGSTGDRGKDTYYYAITNIKKPNGKRTMLRLHTLLMRPAKGFQVDHINRDMLDNRRKNLRLATPSQNQANRKSKKRFKGVFWHKEYKKWSAAVMKDGEIFRLGFFTDKVEAAKTYDAKARELHGEFALTNFAEGASVGD